MSKAGRGFTLIELMVVVSILGVLAVIAIPVYQGYASSSQVKRVYSELSAYRPAVEEFLVRGQYLMSNSDIGYVQSNLTEEVSGNIARFEADGTGTLMIVLGGDAALGVAGALITLTRSGEGNWSCDVDGSAASDWKPFYMPKECD